MPDACEDAFTSVSSFVPLFIFSPLPYFRVSKSTARAYISLKEPYTMDVLPKLASLNSETRSSRSGHLSRSNGGHQRLETMDDLRRVVSSWIDHDEDIPVDWRKEIDAMYVAK